MKRQHFVQVNPPASSPLNPADCADAITVAAADHAEAAVTAVRTLVKTPEGPHTARVVLAPGKPPCAVHLLDMFFTAVRLEPSL